MMTKSLKDIIQEYKDIYLIKVEKPDKKDKSTWKFHMIDPRWTDDSFKDYKFKTVHLRRENCFFLAFKSSSSDAYFVDLKRAMCKKSVQTYVSSLIDYSVKTNDISRTKDEPSFRITQNEMKRQKIDNFLDLCYAYKEYTAIGTGLTRDIRNLVVMDIDVDCTRPDNMEEIHNLLLLFAKYDSLPDFYIFNRRSKHIQLQWVIKDLQYKDICKEMVSSVTNELDSAIDKNREIDFRKIDFSEISQMGVEYRRYTMGLCDIVKKRKFGDKNYTFWKAKNPMSALAGVYDLELKIPYFENGEIQCLTEDEMWDCFSTKESRKKYFDAAPTFQEWHQKMSELMDPLVEKITEKKARKIDDAQDVSGEKPKPVTFKKPKENSRNNFVLKCGKDTTTELAKMYGCRTPEDFKKLPEEIYHQLWTASYDLTRQRYKTENERYGGIWPGTSNMSPYTMDEFRKTFTSSFNYVENHIKNFSYTDEDRKKSMYSRQYQKKLKLIVVDRIKNSNTKISRKKLLEEVNEELKKLYIKKTSLGSLKRFIAESNELTNEKRKELNEMLESRKEQINSRKT